MTYDELLKGRVSPSRMLSWTQCQRRARHEQREPKRYGTAEHVSAWVGTAAHAALRICTEEKLRPDEIHERILGSGSRKWAQERPARPDPVEFDTVSPTWKVTDLQVAEIVSKAISIIEVEGLTVLRFELEVDEQDDQLPIKGTLDMYGIDLDASPVILDLKTGRQLQAGVWLQLGAYALAADRSKVCAYEETRVAMLHVPRAKQTEVQKGSIAYRDAEPLVEDAYAIACDIRRIMECGGALPSPGMHCAACQVKDCAVRASEEGPQ